MKALSDPANDRGVKHVKPPPHRPLTRELMFPPELKSKSKFYNMKKLNSSKKKKKIFYFFLFV